MPRVYRGLRHTLLANGRRYCGYCALDLVENRDKASLDHFLPKSKFKRIANSPSNWLLACKDCNNKKGADLWDQKFCTVTGKKIKPYLMVIA